MKKLEEVGSESLIFSPFLTAYFVFLCPTTMVHGTRVGHQNAVETCVCVGGGGKNTFCALYI